MGVVDPASDDRLCAGAMERPAQGLGEGTLRLLWPSREGGRGRTIADLAGQDGIAPLHVAEAIQFCLGSRPAGGGVCSWVLTNATR